MAKQNALIYLYFLILFSGALVSCKKEKGQNLTANITPVANNTPIGSEPSPIALLNADAFRKSKDWYLWNSQLPSSFNVSGYTDPADVMSAIRQFSMESGFSAPVDKWSFAMKKTEWDLLSGGLSSVASSNNAAGDFGITVSFRAEGDLRVRLVEPHSPAGILGIKRGWRIVKINGNPNVSTSNAQFIIDNIYKAAYANVNFLMPDGNIVDLQLQAAHYAEKPVYLDAVINGPNGNIGYLVYNSFLGNVNQVSAEFARVFNRFATEGVTNLVVDLRYNGGGYVSLQRQLANYIINSSANGSVMMRQIYNSNHTNENETVTFNKTGSLQLSKVYFIVGKSTASASELLINNLKPFMDVRLIGNSNTHGKPVGFFPIENGEWYVFPVSFKTVNKNGEGNYYNGFVPNALIADGLDKDWGDVTEASLASALRNINEGNYRPIAEPSYSEQPMVASGNDALEKTMLKVTIGK